MHTGLWIGKNCYFEVVSNTMNVFIFIIFSIIRHVINVRGMCTSSALFLPKKKREKNIKRNYIFSFSFQLLITYYIIKIFCIFIFIETEETTTLKNFHIYVCERENAMGDGIVLKLSIYSGRIREKRRQHNEGYIGYSSFLILQK